MTAHWVNESFNRLSAVLHAQKIEGSHSGIAICHMLEAMLDTYMEHFQRESSSSVV